MHGLIELGRALELTVVAQGVESEAQAAALRALGCTYAQGPYLGHDAFPDRVETAEPDEEAGLDEEAGPDDTTRSGTESLWAPGTMSTEPMSTEPMSTEPMSTEPMSTEP